MWSALLVALTVAAAPSAELSAAQKAYADVDYGRCLEKARAALGQPGSLPDRVSAWKLVGLCAAAEGETDVARAAFARFEGGFDPYLRFRRQVARVELQGLCGLFFCFLAKNKQSGEEKRKKCLFHIVIRIPLL